MTFTLRPGRFFAGVSIPFFVPNSLLIDKISELGGQRVKIVSRDDIAIPFVTQLNGQNIRVDPRLDPKYDDDWSEMVVADYSGPVKEINVERKWKWIMLAQTKAGEAIQPSPAPIITTVPQPKPAAASSVPAIFLFLGLGVVGFAAVKALRR